MKFLKNGWVLFFVFFFLFSCATVEEEKVPAAPVVEEEQDADTPEPAPEPVVESGPEPEPAAGEPSKVEPVSQGDRPEGVSEEVEPNNDPETANYADFGKPITLSINPKKDYDWFRVFVEKQGYIQVLTKDVPRGLTLQARYCTYDEMEGTTEIRNWSYIPDGCAVMPGEYYICIIDDYHDDFSGETFQLMINFLDEMDESEINNSEETAREVEPGTTIQTAIYPRGDADWFKVKVEEQGYLQTLAKDAPRGLNLQVRYSTYDEWDGTTVIRNWSYIPDGCFVTPGEYYICLIDDYNDKDSPEAFPFRIDFLKEIDKGEPNNTPDLATPLEPGQTFAPAMYPQGDQDWFVVEVDKPGYLRLTTREVPRALNLQVRYAIHDEWDGTTVLRNWKYLPDGCRVEPGVYHICLIDDYNDKAAAETFPFRLELLDEMDPAEPNDSPAEAKPFSPGEAKTMAVYPMGDHDYYAVKLDNAGTINLQAQDVPRGIGLQVSLLTPKDDNPSEYSRIEGYKRLPAEYSLEAGRQYYLQFLDDYNDKSAVEVFRVKMDLQ